MDCIVKITASSDDPRCPRCDMQITQVRKPRIVRKKPYPKSAEDDSEDHKLNTSLSEMEEDEPSKDMQLCNKLDDVIQWVKTKYNKEKF